MVYIPVALIIIAVILLGYRKWKNLHAERSFKATLPDTFASATDPQMAVLSIVMCNKAIISGIDCMLALSAMEACRNNRVFDTLYSGYEIYRKDNTNLPGNEYLNHIWNTGLKITEITRGIAVSTDTHLTEREKTDIAELRDDILHLTDTIILPNTGILDISTEASKVKESVSAHIRRYTNSMGHNDYNEGSVRYSYLRLLHYLYSYFLSIQKISYPASLYQIPSPKQ